MRITFFTQNITEERKYPVVFGKISRITGSVPKLYENTSEESKNETDDFFKRIYVKYGHKSIADHFTMHVSFEDISMNIAKLLEKQRYCAFPLEKSSRYVEFLFDNLRDVLNQETIDDKAKIEVLCKYFNLDYFKNELIIDSNLNDELRACVVDYYTSVINSYYEMKEIIKTFYEETYIKAFNKLKETNPELNIPEFKLREKLLDSIRVLLPVNTKTVVGMTYTYNGFINLLYNLLEMDSRESNEIAESLIEKMRESVGDYFPENLIEKIKKEADEYKKTVYNIKLSYNDKEIQCGIKDFDPDLINIKDEDISMLYTNPIAILNSDADMVRLVPYKLDNKKLKEYIQLCDYEDTDISKVTDNIYHHFSRFLEHAGVFSANYNIDFGAWRDVSRHRTQSNIVSNFIVPFNGVSLESIIPGLVYRLPVIELVRDENHNFKEETLQAMDMKIYTEFESKLNFVYDEYKKRLSKIGEKYIKTVKAASFVFPVDSNHVRPVDLLEFISGLSILATNINASSIIDLRTLIHIANTRSTPAGNNNYIKFAKELRTNLLYILDSMGEDFLTKEEIKKFDNIFFKKLHKNTDYINNL